MKTVTIPLRIQSVSNLREHCRARAKRTKSEREIVFWAMGISAVRPPMPCTVTLTRIAPRSFDCDNMQSGCKAARDAIAQWLCVDDGDPRVTWVYAQRRGGPKQYMAEIKIESTM